MKYSYYNLSNFKKFKYRKKRKKNLSNEYSILYLLSLYFSKSQELRSPFIFDISSNSSPSKRTRKRKKEEGRMARNDGCLEGCETQKWVGGEKWNDELPDAGTRFIPAFRIVRAAHVSTHTTTTSYSEPSRITREPSSLYARRRMYATPVLPMFP